ncbi:MAG: L,D-transpeptidase [Solirubrobacteraceae bacterium]
MKGKLVSAAGAHLRRQVRFRFSVGAPSQTRLVQLLSMQGYLPLRFRPAHRHRWTSVADQTALFAPPAGRLLFEPGWPGTLHTLWRHDPAALVRGAVMAFEASHRITMDGAVGPTVWGALERAQERHQRSPVAYSYAIAAESSPESLTVWHAGREVLHSLANTGIPAAPTAFGTYPVYERLQSQVMKGTNPDGSHYADPVSWVAYFHGGDAVHYFPRSSFGYPQSLGCVELPYPAAQTAWGYLTYGTLVTVAP